VYEGVKNNIWKDEYVEIIARDRYKICSSCSELDLIGKKCAVPNTQPCCGNCGCSLGFKIRALSSSCPIKKWDVIMSEKEEVKLKKLQKNKKK
jgi:hypothetical protein